MAHRYLIRSFAAPKGDFPQKLPVLWLICRAIQLVMVDASTHLPCLHSGEVVGQKSTAEGDDEQAN